MKTNDNNMKKNKPFNYKIQNIILISFLLSFVLIMQQISIHIYKVGIVLLIVTGLLQNVFGNISPEANKQNMLKGFIKNGLIVVAIFVISILVAPSLVMMGRG